ncbi:MAG: glycosyltransferase family 2 protein [Isosphaeraceae bacterium]
MGESPASCPIVPGLVSIVIPCYDGARFLAEAIESCLRQTYPHVEIIVVDDASPDDCAAIAASYADRDRRVRLIRCGENGGVSRAFNTGFHAAQGEFFSRLAQDDLFREDAIMLMVNYMRRDQDCGLVYCDCQLIDEAGRVTGQGKVADPIEALADGQGLGLCVLWRSSVWEKVGGFDPEFDTAEDFEYWLRISTQFPVCKCYDGAPFFFRTHERMGSNRFAVRQEFAHWKARIRHCGSWWEARRLKGRCYAEVGYIHRSNRRILLALCYATASVLYWPFVLKHYRGLIRTLGDACQVGAGRLLQKLRRPLAPSR